MATAARVATHDRADRNFRYFAALAAAARRLSGSLDRASINHAVVQEVQRALDIDAATIRVATPDGRLPIVAASGIGPRVLRQMPDVGVDEAWFRTLKRNRRPWVRADMEPESEYPSGARYRSSALVPLVQDRDVIGVLTAVHQESHAWDRDEIAFLQAVAGQAVIALQNADIYEQSQRWAGQLAVVQASMARMNRLTSREEIGQAVVEETRRVIAYHNCRVYLLEPPDDLVPIAFKGEVGTYVEIPIEVLHTKVGRGFTGWSVEHGEALLINDANADPRGASIPGTDEVDESMVVVPMMFDDEVLGAVTLSKLGLNQFDERDVRLMQILADAAATAIQSGRGLDESRRATARMQRLLAMSSDLSRSLDPLAVADLIARHLGQAAGADETTISYWDRSRDRVLAWGRFPARQATDLVASVQLAGQPLTRRVLEEQMTILLDGSAPHTNLTEAAVLEARGLQSLVMLPLVEAGRSIGLVEMAGCEALQLDTATLDLVHAMANEAAMMLENARLYEDARNLADRDPLTNFLNHRSFYERLGEELLRAQRSRQAVALMMIDLDGFKLVNDTRGHQIGDQVLRWTAERIRSAVRATDVPARYGGDEFAIILPDADVSLARVAAQRIIAAFGDDAFSAANGASVPIGVSIG
ncbi:MAG: GAF domain-containing protein, partial [Candidatus Limnocylindrales bacterium]